jgi:hypothetical protein
MKRHHAADTAGSTVCLSADPLTASLLKRKQVEKICVHNILREEYRSGAYKWG